MKRKIMALVLAASMTLSSMSFTVFAEDSTLAETTAVEETSTAVEEEVDSNAVADETTSSSAVDLAAAVTTGWTSGNTGTSTHTITGDLSSGVSIAPVAEKKGKWSNTDDQFGYFAVPVTKDKDFTFTVDVTVDAMNVIGTGSATQSTVGVGVFNALEKTPNSVALAAYAPSSSATYMNFQANYRADATERNWVGDALSTDAVKLLGGTDAGPFTLKIQKISNFYKVSCGENSYTIDDSSNTILTNDTVYVGVMAARQGAATFNNMSLEVEDRTVSSLEITKAPSNTEFVVDNDPTFDDMEVTVKYSDGSSEVTNDYAVICDKSALGTQTAYITKGGVTTPIEISFIKNKATKINITAQPLKNEYYIGQKLDTKLLEVAAEFFDGSSNALEVGEYELYIAGKAVNDGDFITEEMASADKVEVKYTATDAIESGTAVGSFPITVHSDYSLRNIIVSTRPATTTFYVGDEIDTTGLMVRAYYQNAAGTVKYDTLQDSEFVLDTTSFDGNKAGVYSIKVAYAYNTDVTTTFDLNVIEKTVIKFLASNYPVTTYQTQTGVTARDVVKLNGLNMQYFYSNGVYEDIKMRNIIYAEGDVETVNADGLYDVDLTAFDVSTPTEYVKDSAGNVVKTTYTSYIKIVDINGNFPTVELPVTVKDVAANFWYGMKFGASTNSTNTVSGGIDSGKITLNAGSCTSDGSGSAGGKLATDHDGLSFYYTRTSSDQNFRLIADVTVNEYLTKNFDDTSRAGQEAWGLMVRDSIPMKNSSGNITDKASEAVKNSDGEPTNKSGDGTDFFGNMVLLGGYSGTSYPTDTTSTTYEKNRDINRINLCYRKGIQVYSDGTGSERAIAGSTMNDNFFAAGDKFKLTLEKVNGGYMGTCYDYQTGKTKTNYYFISAGEDEILSVQDPDNVYIGFFAARFANITVENVELYVTDPGTDNKTYSSNTASLTPRITITSSLFVTDTNYNLTVKPTNKSGGYVTIRQNGQVIATKVPVNKTTTMFPTTLVADSENKFEVYYTPKYLDPNDSNYEELTSYDEILVTETVVHKSVYNESDTIYVSPEGTMDGDGTIENPYDFDTALGYLKRGQTIYMLGGVYKRTTSMTIPATNAGTESARKTIIGEPGKEVIFDMQGVSAGMTLSGDYWTIKNIDFIHSADNQRAFQLGASYSIIEDCKFYDNGDTGMQVSRTSSSDNMLDWPHNNIIKNCEVWNSADPSGINADGFGCKLTVGVGNKFVGCVSHHNLDDGWDLYTKGGTGAIGTVVLDGCISYKQGYKLNADGTSATSYWSNKAGHNGLKMGGENVAVQHVVKDCIIFENGGSGVTSNSNPQMTVRDTVSYKNVNSNFSLSSSNTAAYNYDLKGAVSYKGGSSDKVGGSTNWMQRYNYLDGKNTIKVYSAKDADGKVTELTDLAASDVTDSTEFYAKDGVTKLENYTGYTTVTDSFFESVDYTDVLVDGHFAQDADGNFITNKFLKLTEDSKAAIAGVDGYEDQTTEATTEETETTTKANNHNSSSSSSSSNSSNSSNSGSGSNNTEDKTEAVEDESAEETTSEDESAEAATSEDESVEATTSEAVATVEEEVVNTTEISAEDLEANKYVVKVDDKESNVFEVTVPVVDEVVGIAVPGGTVYLPKKVADTDKVTVTVKNAGVLSEKVQAVSKNMISVEIKDADGKNVELKDSMWIELAYTGDTSEPHKIIAVSVDNNGNTTVIRSGYYDKKTGTVMIPATETGVFAAILSDVTFADLEGNWAKVAVETLAARGIINGVTENSFNPNANITRGDFTKILVNILNVTSNEDHGFTDVSSSDYYNAEIAAAKANGIINGLTESTFGPKESITRQDMMVVVAKTLEAMGVKTEVADLGQFTDADEIASYAKDSVAKLVGMGLINGNNGEINPTDTLTRAEAAKVLADLWDTHY